MNKNAHLKNTNNSKVTKSTTKDTKKVPAKPRPKSRPKPPTSDDAKDPETLPAKAATKPAAKLPATAQTNGHRALILDAGLAPRPPVEAVVVPAPAGPCQPAAGAKIAYCADDTKPAQPPATGTTPAKELHPQTRSLSGYRKLPRNDPYALCSMFSAGELVMVGGFTGQGKSPLFGPQFGLCAAAGADWFGLHFKAPYKVLVVGFENTPQRQALGTLGAMHKLFPTWTQEQQRLAEENYSDFMLCDALLDDTDDNKPGVGFAFIAWLNATLTAKPRKILILDTYGAFCGCGFTEQEATTAFLRQGLQSVATRHGCVIIVIHHFVKPSKDSVHAGSELGLGPMYLFNGSSEIQNYFRAFIALVPTPYRDDDGHRVFALRTDKRTIMWNDKNGSTLDRSGRPYTEMWVRWSPKIWADHGLYAWEHSPLTPDMAPALELKAALAAKAEKDALKAASKGN